MTPVSAYAEGLLSDIAAGYVPGPNQFRSLIRQLSAAGLIVESGTKTLAMGVGPEVRVPVYALTSEGHAVANQPRPGEHSPCR